MKVAYPGLFLLCILELVLKITECASSPVTWVTDPRFVAGISQVIKEPIRTLQQSLELLTIKQ